MVNGVFRQRHDDRCKGVTEDIDGDEARRHQAMDTEDETDRRNRHRAGRRERGNEHHNRRAGDAGAAFRGDQQDAQQRDLLADRKIDARGLREKDRSGGEVQAGSVVIESISRREDEADD